MNPTQGEKGTTAPRKRKNKGLAVKPSGSSKRLDEEPQLRFLAFFHCETIPKILFTRAEKAASQWSEKGELDSSPRHGLPLLHCGAESFTTIIEKAVRSNILRDEAHFYTVEETWKDRYQVGLGSEMARSIYFTIMGIVIRAFPEPYCEFTWEETEDQLWEVVQSTCVPFLGVLDIDDIKDHLTGASSQEKRQYLVPLLKLLNRLAILLGRRIPLNIPRLFSDSVQYLQELGAVSRTELHYLQLSRSIAETLISPVSRPWIIAEKLQSFEHQGSKRSNAAIGLAIASVSTGWMASQNQQHWDSLKWSPLMPDSTSTLEFVAQASIFGPSSIPPVAWEKLSLNAKILIGFSETKKKHFDNAYQILQELIKPVLLQFGLGSMEVLLAGSTLINCCNATRRGVEGEKWALLLFSDLSQNGSIKLPQQTYAAMALADSYIGQYQYEKATRLLHEIMGYSDVPSDIAMSARLRLLKISRRLSKGPGNSQDWKHLSDAVQRFKEVPDRLKFECLEEVISFLSILDPSDSARLPQASHIVQSLSRYDISAYTGSVRSRKNILENLEALQNYKDQLNLFSFTGPQLYYCRKMRDRFPCAKVQFIEKVGGANWHRFLRIKKMRESADTEEDEIVTLEPAPAVSKSSFQDSGLGSSIETQSKQGCPRIPVKARRAKSVLSTYSFRSFMSHEEGAAELPPMPPAGGNGEIICTICERILVDVSEAKWKQHLFLDLRPYICIVEDCEADGLGFASRTEFAAHLATHQYLKSFVCTICDYTDETFRSLYVHRDTVHGSEIADGQTIKILEKTSLRDLSSQRCPFCDIIPGAPSFVGHICHHLEELSFSAIPQEPDSDDNDSELADVANRLRGSEISSGSEDSTYSRASNEFATDSSGKSQASPLASPQPRVLDPRPIIDDAAGEQIVHPDEAVPRPSVPRPPLTAQFTRPARKSAAIVIKTPNGHVLNPKEEIAKEIARKREAEMQAKRDEEDELERQISEMERAEEERKMRETIAQRIPSDPEEFMGHLGAFMRSKNLPLDPPLIIADRPIDYNLLYKAVVRYGGYRKITQAKSWPYVAQALYIRPGQSLSVVQKLSSYYERNLLVFEESWLPDQLRQLTSSQVKANSSSKTITANEMRKQPEGDNLEHQIGGMERAEEVPPAKKEVDECYRKITQSVVEFGNIYEKIEQSKNASQKVKLGEILKKEIEELQRHHGQLQFWAISRHFKEDKRPLAEYQKLIKTQMDKFKGIENLIRKAEDEELERQIEEMEQAEKERERKEAELLESRRIQDTAATNALALQQRLKAEANDRKLVERELEMERLEGNPDQERVEKGYEREIADERRYTVDRSPVSPKRESSRNSSTYSKVALLEKKKLEYLRLREQKRRFESEMDLLESQQQQRERELAAMDSQYRMQGPAHYEIVLNQRPSSFTNCYVGNLAPLTTQTDFIPLFQNFGYVVEAHFQASRGWAYVSMDTHENAAMAICQLNGYNVNGRPLVVQWGDEASPYYLQSATPIFLGEPHDSNPIENAPCNTLYIGNLPFDTSEEELKAMFSKQRGYKRLVFRTKQNGPMAFVEFENISLATHALHELYGHPLHNSKHGGIRPSFAKNPLNPMSTGQQVRNQMQSHSQPTAQPAPPPLPEGWIAQWDEMSRQYYFVQMSTGISQWDKPTHPTLNSVPTGPRPHEHPFGMPGQNSESGLYDTGSDQNLISRPANFTLGLNAQVQGPTSSEFWSDAGSSSRPSLPQYSRSQKGPLIDDSQLQNKTDDIDEIIRMAEAGIKPAPKPIVALPDTRSDQNITPRSSVERSGVVSRSRNEGESIGNATSTARTYTQNQRTGFIPKFGDIQPIPDIPRIPKIPPIPTFGDIQHSRRRLSTDQLPQSILDRLKHSSRSPSPLGHNQSYSIGTHSPPLTATSPQQGMLNNSPRILDKKRPKKGKGVQIYPNDSAPRNEDESGRSSTNQRGSESRTGLEASQKGYQRKLVVNESGAWKQMSSATHSSTRHVVSGRSSVLKGISRPANIPPTSSSVNYGKVYTGETNVKSKVSPSEYMEINEYLE